MATKKEPAHAEEPSEKDEPEEEKPAAADDAPSGPEDSGGDFPRSATV